MVAFNASHIVFFRSSLFLYLLLEFVLLSIHRYYIAILCSTK